ncbi:hypothetical protein TruAng_000245 [Truncatella angustata]|nr:hypothetical protein TruAng_000245 [Truncatella angustata]
MKVFCPAHIYHHKALPGPRKARDLECFVDFWMDYAYDSLASTIRHPELWDELSFNKPAKFNERRKSKKSSDGSGYDAGVDVLDPTDGEKSRNSEPNYDEESCDGGQSGNGDVGAPHEEMDDSPRKLDAQQFKKMFREYAAELLLYGIAFERS